MKLENSIQDNKTIQNLKFNSETKLVRGGPGLGRQALPLRLQGSQARRGAALCRARLPAPPRPSQPAHPSISLPSVCLSACLI